VVATEAVGADVADAEMAGEVSTLEAPLLA
jgi:hypothetical protein